VYESQGQGTSNPEPGNSSEPGFSKR